MNRYNVHILEGVMILSYMRTGYPIYLASLLTLVLVLCGCQGDAVKINPPVLGEPFTLRVGESATISKQDLTLTFVEVIRDVRCPTFVQCAEDGPVEIAVTLQVQDGDTTRYEMNPEAVPESIGWAPRQVWYSDYLVELMSVDPHPETVEDLEDFTDYQATFVIEKGE